jgi:transcriptional regulator with XRE-family HTH domain
MTHTASLRTLWGNQIRAEREAQDLGVTELARLAEMDPGNLSRVERGLQGVSDELRMRIASALGRRVEDLFTYPDNSNHTAPRRRRTLRGETVTIEGGQIVLRRDGRLTGVVDSFPDSTSLVDMARERAAATGATFVSNEASDFEVAG